MNVLIIEDERNSVEKLKNYLRQIDPGIKIMAELRSVRESIRFLRERRDPDLIFIDIQLADGESFEIFEQVSSNAFLIFVTAYDQHALRALDLKVVSYLLKPFDQQDVVKALKKYDGFQEQRKMEVPKERFVVKKGNRSYTFSIHDIAYFFKDEVLYLVARSGERFLMDHTLDELEAILSPVLFFRVNRSCIIHYESIESFIPDSSHRYRIKLKQVDTEMIVSQSRSGDFRRWVQAF